jgi:hypothetical protein
MEDRGAAFLNLFIARLDPLCLQYVEFSDTASPQSGPCGFQAYTKALLLDALRSSLEFILVWLTVLAHGGPGVHHSRPYNNRAQPQPVKPCTEYRPMLRPKLRDISQ